MTIMRTLQYGLIATAMNYDQCNIITKQLISGILPKMGIIRTVNTKLATGTPAMRGNMDSQNTFKLPPTTGRTESCAYDNHENITKWINCHSYEL